MEKMSKEEAKASVEDMKKFVEFEEEEKKKKETQSIVIANLSLKRPLNIDDIRYGVNVGFECGMKFVKEHEKE